MAKKHMKRCVPSSVIREMQILITVRCHWMPIRMAEIKMEKTTNLTVPSVGKHVKHEACVGTADGLYTGPTALEKVW